MTSTTPAHDIAEPPEVPALVAVSDLDDAGLIAYIAAINEWVAD